MVTNPFAFVKEKAVALVDRIPSEKNKKIKAYTMLAKKYSGMPDVTKYLQDGKWEDAGKVLMGYAKQKINDKDKISIKDKRAVLEILGLYPVITGSEAIRDMNSDYMAKLAGIQKAVEKADEKRAIKKDEDAKKAEEEKQKKLAEVAEEKNRSESFEKIKTTVSGLCDLNEFDTGKGLVVKYIIASQDYIKNSNRGIDGELGRYNFCVKMLEERFKDSNSKKYEDFIKPYLPNGTAAKPDTNGTAAKPDATGTAKPDINGDADEIAAGLRWRTAKNMLEKDLPGEQFKSVRDALYKNYAVNDDWEGWIGTIDLTLTNRSGDAKVFAEKAKTFQDDDKKFIKGLLNLAVDSKKDHLVDNYRYKDKTEAEHEFSFDKYNYVFDTLCWKQCGSCEYVIELTESHSCLPKSK